MSEDKGTDGTASLRSGESCKSNLPALYVGTMNDGIFIIDQPPRPAPVDHVAPIQDVGVIAKMVENDEAATKLAKQFAAAPEMFKAIVAYALPALEKHAHPFNHEHRACQVLRDAIAKATGA